MGGQAFDAPRFGGFFLDPDDVKIIGIDISPEEVDGEVHYLYDPRAHLPLNEAFVRNVMAIGVKKPILVTKIGNNTIVVDGRQRTKVAREAKKRLGSGTIFRIPALLQKGDEAMLTQISIATNDFTVQPTALEKAKRAQLLLDRGNSLEEVAVMFEVSVKSIQNWTQKLLTLSSPIQEAIEAEVITSSAASCLSDLSPEEQKNTLEQLVAEKKKPTIKQTDILVKRNKGIKQFMPPSKKVLNFIVEKATDYNLDSDFVRGVKWALGRLESVESEAVVNLSKAIEDAGKSPAKKRNSKKVQLSLLEEEG
jgi:ParB-like chromosome segregation protein Spo0J